MKPARTTALILLAACAAVAQTPEAPAATGSISGVVLDAAGQPLAGTSLTLATATKGLQTGKTDAQGRFLFSGLAPAVYQLTAHGTFDVLATRTITLDTGQNVAAELRALSTSTISGRVLDQDREPAAGLQVYLMGCVYQAGAIVYQVQSFAVPDERGRYTLGGIRPGAAYVLVARRRPLRSDAISAEAEDPGDRKPAPAEAWYPGVTAVEAAERLVLYAGEQRENVDIRVPRLPSRCVEARLETPDGPWPLEYQVFDAAGIQVSTGQAGRDGRIRLCRPEHGEFRIAASLRTPPLFASATVPAGDADVKGLRIVAQPPVSLRGQVAWDGDPPSEPVEGTVTVAISPVNRLAVPLENGARAKVSMPGTFTLEALGDEQIVSATLSAAPAGFYVKEVTSGGVRLEGSRLNLAAAAGMLDLRVAIARDGGSLTVQVQDADGKPVPEAWVIALPADAPSPAALSRISWAGRTNASGAYLAPIRPGKYVVLTTSWLDLNTETMAHLWRQRDRAVTVEVGPGASANVTIR